MKSLVITLKLTLNRHDDLGNQSSGQHAIRGFTSVLGLIIIRACHKAKHILGFGAHGCVGVIYPFPILVPYDGCQGVATVGLADQADCLPHADCLALNVADDFWPLWWI